MDKKRIEREYLFSYCGFLVVSWVPSRNPFPSSRATSLSISFVLPLFQLISNTNPIIINGIPKIVPITVKENIIPKTENTIPEITSILSPPFFIFLIPYSFKEQRETNLFSATS